MYFKGRFGPKKGQIGVQNWTFLNCSTGFTDKIPFYWSTIQQRSGKGPFKYYVIKEVGGWGQKMAIFDDLQYCKSSKRWVGGPKKTKNMMT